MISNGNSILTTKEAAAMVGLSVSRLRELANAGIIKFYRPQGRRKMIFKAKDVAHFFGCKVEDL